MNTVTVTGIIPNYPTGTVTARLVYPIISDGEIVPPKDITATAVVGAVTLTLPIADDGAARYKITLPAETGRPAYRFDADVDATTTDLTPLLSATLGEYDVDALVTEAAARAAADAALDTRVDALELAPPAHTHDDRYYTESEADARYALLRHVTAQALTDAASIVWDTSLGHLASVTLGGNRTLAAPTNGVAGTYILRVTQGSGGQTLAYNAAFKWAGGSAPVLSTAAGAVDVLSFVSPDGSVFYGSCMKAFS